MADYTDTKVSQFIINNLTQEKFEELKAKGQLQDDQIYCTPDTLAEQLANKADVDLNNTQALKKTGGDLLGTLRLEPNILASSANETEIMLLSGSSTANGALFVVYGQNGATPGAFLARAANSSGTLYDLIGSPDGMLVWGGKQILREQAGSLGLNGYIKLHTGQTIQWGQQAGRIVTFPTPFSGTVSVVANLNRNSDTDHGWNYVYDVNLAGFKFVAGSDTEWFNWIAIGY